MYLKNTESTVVELNENSDVSEHYDNKYRCIAMNITTTQVCPRCKSNLRLIVEAENKPKSAIITYLYVCDTCRYRKVIENIVLKKDGSRLIVLKSTANKLS